MNYPFWDVALIGSGWVIGLIAIFHVMISHFAVGGGLLIPLLERHALQLKSPEWLSALHRNMKFFLIITGVLGTVSGVGIWFSIGLAQPAGTSALIHTFVFFWAIEWVFFLIELTSAAVYYYTWGRISEKLHQAIGWTYCISSFVTLVVINGILSFMLTPGEGWLRAAWLDRIPEAVLSAFFNPTYWPSLFIRFLAALSLASVFILMFTSRLQSQVEPELKTSLSRYVLRGFIPAFLLLPLALFGFLCTLPEHQLDLLRLGSLGIFPIACVVIFGSVAAAIVAFLFIQRNPLGWTPSRAWILMILAAAVVASAEYSREMLRKPYVIAGYMYSNGIRVADVEKFNTEGFLTQSRWVNSQSSYGIGEAMFRGQCMSCHTWDGYRSMNQLLQGRSIESLQSVLDMLYEHREESAFSAYMPPLVGTLAERRALIAYLEQKSKLRKAP